MLVTIPIVGLITLVMPCAECSDILASNGEAVRLLASSIPCCVENILVMKELSESSADIVEYHRERTVTDTMDADV